MNHDNPDLINVQTFHFNLINHELTALSKLRMVIPIGGARKLDSV